MSTAKITIPFHDKLLVLIDHDEKPFVAMRPIVEGMDMSWKSQQRKLTTRFASTVVIMTTVEAKRVVSLRCWLFQLIPMPSTMGRIATKGFSSWSMSTSGLS
jgi:hypothetical protein